MDFLPDKIHKGTNSDGTKYRISEWGRDSIGFVELPTGLGWLSFVAVLGFTLPILTLFVRKNLVLNLISFFIGTYLVIDYTEYWLFSRFYMIFFSEQAMLVIISLTIVATWLNLLKIALDLFIPPNYITFVAVILLFVLGTIFKFNELQGHNSYFVKRNIEMKR